LKAKIFSIEKTIPVKIKCDFFATIKEQRFCPCFPTSSLGNYNIYILNKDVGNEMFNLNKK